MLWITLWEHDIIPHMGQRGARSKREKRDGREKIREEWKHQKAAGLGSNTLSLSVSPFFFTQLFICTSLSSSPLSLSGYLFPDLEEQTVMQTDLLWGVKLHIQLPLSIGQPK